MIAGRALAVAGAGPLAELARQLREMWRARRLLWTLTRREVTARHAGTAFGAFWAYAQPLLTLAAYVLVFDIVFAMRLGPNAPTARVGLFLVVGALPWMAFCDGLNRGMNSLIEAGGLLQKNALPPGLFPLRAVLASAVIYAPLMLLLLLAYGPQHGLAPALLAVLPLLAAQWLLCALLAWALAICTAALRDTAQVVGFLLSLGIFLSPVLFPIEQFPAAARWVLWLNPMTAPVLGFQQVLLRGEWPQAGLWLVMAGWLLATALLLGLLLRRSRDQLVDWL